MGFHYSHSFYLVILGALAVALHIWSRWNRKKDIQNLGDWRVIQQLIPLEALKRRSKKEKTVLFALFILIFSATGPQLGNRLKEVKQRGVDVFIAIDTSRSMLAEDVAPSRMDRAKQSLGLLIRKLEGNRVGIIAFAKFAVVQCPLTVDTEAAQMFLDLVDTNTVPKQGTALGDAIRLGVESFNKDDKTGKAIILLTDGEDHQSDPLGAAKLAREKGVKIFTIGIGTTKGEVIKNRDESGTVTEFLKHKGEMVLSRLDDSLLSKIAEITEGHYYRASSNDKEIDEIAEILNGLDKKEFSTKMYQRREERYQWFGFLALLILLIEFFIGEKTGQWKRIQQIKFKNKALLLFLLCLLPTLAQADLKEHVRRGNELLKKKDFTGARGEFESALIDAPEAAFLPYNIATTYYLEGNFEEAKKKYKQAMTMTSDPHLQAKAAYNLGHLTFSMGDREGAIERFKECLRLVPDDVDAKYNIEYIRSGKNPQNPMKQKPKEDEGTGDKKDQQKQEGTDSEKKKNGEISKEDAERILEMMNDQEKEKQKEAQKNKQSQPKKNDDKNGNNEDW